MLLTCGPVAQPSPSGMREARKLSRAETGPVIRGRLMVRNPLPSSCVRVHTRRCVCECFCLCMHTLAQLSACERSINWYSRVCVSKCINVRLVQIRRTRAISTVLTVPYRNMAYRTEQKRSSWLEQSKSVQDGGHRTVQVWCNLAVWLQFRPKTLRFLFAKIVRV